MRRQQDRWIVREPLDQLAAFVIQSAQMHLTAMALTFFHHFVQALHGGDIPDMAACQAIAPYRRPYARRSETID